MTQPFDFADLVEEASSRAGGESTTASDVYTLQRSLFLIQQDWMQMGYPTWRVETTMLYTSGVVSTVQLPELVDDVIQVNSLLDGTLNELPMKRIPADQYMQITNKETQGRPTQYYLQRSEPPVLHVYPIGTPGTVGGINVMYIRRPEEFERYQPDSDVPARWTRALVQALAVELAKKRPRSDGSYDEGLISRLENERMRAEALASRDDRDRSRYRVNIGRRT